MKYLALIVFALSLMACTKKVDTPAPETMEALDEMTFDDFVEIETE